MVGLEYRDATHRHDIAGSDRARFIHPDGECHLGHIVVQSEDQ